VKFLVIVLIDRNVPGVEGKVAIA